MSGFLKEAIKSTCRSPYFLTKRSYSSSGKSNQSTQTTKTPVQPIQKTQSTQTTQAPQSTVKDVPGLSKNILSVPSQEVGPGASKNSLYKNPEYYCYHNVSYFEAEVEMLKYRCPQPSNKTMATK